MPNPSLVSQVLVELVATQLGHVIPLDDDDGEELERTTVATLGGQITQGMEGVKRLVQVDQKPIGRTPRGVLIEMERERIGLNLLLDRANVQVFGDGHAPFS